MDFLSKKPMDMSLGKVKEQAALSANSYKEHYVVKKFTNNKDTLSIADTYIDKLLILNASNKMMI